MDPTAHWEKVYSTTKPDTVSWYRAHLDMSLRLIEEAATRGDAAIIDVGGGESTLVDDLLTRGYRDVSVLDISPTALEVAKARLGERAQQVEWLCGDVTKMAFPEHRYDVWHDRAVFHFLTDPEDRNAYVRQVAHSVRTGGYVIVAAFGPEGPTRCSGLPVVRYEPGALHDEFGDKFRLVKHLTELHHTPKGAIQQFIYCFCNITR